MTTFTFKELDAISSALGDVISRLPMSSKYMLSALTKTEDTIDKYCIPQRYNEFVLLPILAKNDEEQE